MKTAEEILKKNTGHSYGLIMDALVIQSMKEYAIEVAKEALKNAKEKVEYEYKDYEEQIDYDFISDESNIPSL